MGGFSSGMPNQIGMAQQKGESGLRLSEKTIPYDRSGEPQAEPLFSKPHSPTAKHTSGRPPSKSPGTSGGAAGRESTGASRTCR